MVLRGNIKRECKKKQKLDFVKITNLRAAKTSTTKEKGRGNSQHGWEDLQIMHLITGL